MNVNEELYWSKLDNTGKLYPAVSDLGSTNVFRMSVYLYDDVNPSILKTALNKSLEAMPIFKVKLRRGLFWPYFEINFDEPIIYEENFYPCKTILKKENNNFLFKVSYFKNKINLEVFHALGDGTGLLQFLNFILYFYLKELHPLEISDDIATYDSNISTIEMGEDAFDKHKDVADIKNNLKTKKAYSIPGTLMDIRKLKVIIAKMPLSDFLKLVKSKKVTVSVYLVSLITYAIYSEDLKKDTLKKPITVCLPTNLRLYFETSTVRNFFTCIYPTIDFTDENYTFDDVLGIISSEFRKYLDKDFLAQRIRYFSKLEKNPLFRVVPLAIKNYAMKGAYRNSENSQTTVVSSLGKIEFKNGIDSFVKDMEVILSPSFSNPVKTLNFSYKDSFYLNFTSLIEDTDIIKFIVRHLTNQGLDISIYTNEVE
ncbi:MAG: hypothetical protein WBH44_01690 [Proteocatella sp.]